MKKMTTVIAMAASVMFAAGVYAKRPFQEPMSEERLAEIVAEKQAVVDELGLLPTEAEQVKALIAEHTQKRAELRASFRESQQTLKDDYQASLSELLTEDQISELRHEMRSVMRKSAKEDRKSRFQKDDTSD